MSEAGVSIVIPVRDERENLVPLPVFRISGATGQGTQELCQAVMRHLEETRVTAEAAPSD